MVGDNTIAVREETLVLPSGVSVLGVRKLTVWRGLEVWGLTASRDLFTLNRGDHGVMAGSLVRDWLSHFTATAMKETG